MIELLVCSIIFYTGFKIGVHFYHKEVTNLEESTMDALEKYHETLAELHHVSYKLAELQSAESEKTRDSEID